MTGGDKFRIDPEAVKGQAPALSQLAQELETGLKSLMQSMNTYGECWGRDEYGAEFAKNYLGKASEALGMTQAAVTILGHMSSASSATAQAATNTDLAIGDAMRRIAPGEDSRRRA